MTCILLTLLARLNRYMRRFFSCLTLRPFADRTETTRLIHSIRVRAHALQQHHTEQLPKLAQSVRQQFSTDRKHQRPASNLKTSIEAFALIMESVRRTTGKSYYDVQLQGGIELSRGRVVQMQTGEGKTLTTALPAFVRALQGNSVHVATTNAYLARRDCEELRPAFELLGLTVGLLPEEHDEQQKRDAYQCDITFGTGYDFGFDFLRDQLGVRARKSLPLGASHLSLLEGLTAAMYQPLQREHQFVVVDEADSVLIDEATMPLILSHPAATSNQGHPPAVQAEPIYQLADRVALAIDRKSTV